MTQRTAPAGKRVRRKYAGDQDIDRFVEAAKRHGLTPHALTFHADGSVTVSDATPSAASREEDDPARRAFEQRQKRKAEGHAPH